MATKKSVDSSVNSSVNDLAAAFRDAIEAAKPPSKKTIANRVENTPWSPPPGVAKVKLKRKIFQHSVPVPDKMLTNEQIELCNRLRPGVFCDGYIKVIRRRDKGLDIDYPIRTAAQRMRLSSVYGIRSFSELLQTCIKEAENPRKSEFDQE